MEKTLVSCFLRKTPVNRIHMEYEKVIRKHMGMRCWIGNRNVCCDLDVACWAPSCFCQFVNRFFFHHFTRTHWPCMGSRTWKMKNVRHSLWQPRFVPQTVWLHLGLLTCEAQSSSAMSQNVGGICLDACSIIGLSSLAWDFDFIRRWTWNASGNFTCCS